MLCGDRCFSPVVRKAFCMYVLRSVLCVFVGLPFWCFANSGDSVVMVSGLSFRVPFLRSVMYSLMAWIDSSAKKVLILSPVFWRIAWYWMILVFGLFRNRCIGTSLRSDTPKPESFIVKIMALSRLLFGYLSKTFSMCCFVARLTPFALPFG